MFHVDIEKKMATVTDMMNIKTIDDVVIALGGNAALARSLGKGPSFISECRRRGSIPGQYWSAIVKVADAAGIQAITADLLARLHEDKTLLPNQKKGKSNGRKKREERSE